MATERFKVIYKDGRQELVTADEFQLDGTWFVFTKDGQEVHRIDEADVRSIGKEDATTPVGPFMA